LELQFWRLPAVEDHFDHVGGEQGEAEHVADVRGIDIFLRGNVLDCAAGPLVEKLLPPKGTDKRLEQYAIDIRSPGHRGDGGAVGCHD
jgi:hypothetical protein